MKAEHHLTCPHLPTMQDLPICQGPPTLEETRSAIKRMKNNRAPGADYAITSEALQHGGDVMAEGSFSGI